MNSIKNLMIIVVLAAVGYGMTVALTRNNVEQVNTQGVADKWQPASSKQDATGANPVKPGGPIPISRDSAQPGGASAPYAPPLTQAPKLTPIEPYPSPAYPSPPTGSPPPSNPPANPGPPAPPQSVAGPMAGSSAPGGVRNLAPPPDKTAAGGADPGAGSSDDSLLQRKFAAFMEEVQKSLDEGKLAEAHLMLSRVYTNPDLPPDMAKQIIGTLDQLAGTVIYSRGHYIEPPYVTRSGETIEQIARLHDVPWQLLARINGLMPPDASNNDEATKDQPLPANMELKVVRGPFDAVVNLEKRELTLMLKDRYAGRFPIGIGKDQPIVEGTYTVRDKILDPAYYGSDGASFANDDPRNPLGDAWIGLTDRIGIHGAADERVIGHESDRGSICTGKRDIQDLYGILSIGSRVTIMR